MAHATLPSAVYQVAGADDDLTVVFWLQPKSWSQETPIFSFVDDTDDSPYFRVTANGSSQLAFEANGAGGTSSVVLDLDAARTTGNHLYVMRWAGSADVLDVFEDGVVVGRDDSVAIGSDAKTEMDDGRLVGFGSTSYTHNHIVRIDEFLVFDRLLTDYEITRLAVAGLGAGSFATAAVSIPMQTVAATANQFGAFIDLPMQTMVAEASFHATAAIELPMQTVEGNGSGGSAVELPMQEIAGEAHQIPLNEIDLPMQTVAAHGGGASLNIGVPMQTVAATGTTEGFATAAIVLPMQAIIAAATQSNSADAAIEIPFQTLEARFGATGAAALPMQTVDATVSVPNVARAAARFPMQLITAAGSTPLVASAAIVLPMQTVQSVSTRAAVLLPMQLVVASARVVSTVYDTYVMNLNTQAVTQYDHWDFDSIVRLGDSYIGFNTDGAYTVGGTDAAGVAFDGQFKTGGLRFGTNELKRVYRTYVTYKPGGALLMKLYKDDVLQATHRLPDPGVTDLVEKRIKISRGRKEKAKYWAFEFLSDAGGGLEIDGMLAMAQKLGRRFR